MPSLSSRAVGAIWLVVALTLTSVAAVALASSFGFRSAVSFVLATYLLAWTIVVCVVYALSIGKWVERWPLLAALAAVTAASGVVWAAAGRPSPPLRGRLSVVRRGCRDRVLAALLVGVAAAYAYAFALAVGTAANDGDPLVYELARAALWRQDGGLGALHTAYDSRLDINPPNTEIGQLGTMVVSDSERYAALPQFLAVGALLVAVFGVARRIGLPGRQAAFGALLVPLLPVVLVQSWTGFTDLVLASFLVAAVYFGLGSRRGELVPFGLAIGLALGTKFLGPLLLPLVAAAVLVHQPARRLPGFALAGLAGSAFGGVWYVVNALRADEALGDVDESGFQDLGLGPVAASLVRYLVELLDLSGSLGADVLVYALAGVALAVAALALRVERGTRLSLLAAAAAVALLPLGVAAARRALAQMGETAWAAGDSEVERWFAENAAQQTVSDGAVSWFGPVGVTMAVAALPLAVAGVRRGAQRTAFVMAAAPFLALLCIALSVVYLRYQGRYFVAGLALSASTWGVAARWRAARVAIATAALVTGFLCLVNSIGKPSGLDLLHEKHRAAVWSMPRWEQQGLLRWSPPERHEIRTIRFVERHVPADARIGIALVTNDFGFPYFGAGLTRHVSVVDAGDTIPAGIDWLVVSPRRRMERCETAWRVAHREPQGWEVWRRVGPQSGCA